MGRISLIVRPEKVNKSHAVCPLKGGCILTMRLMLVHTGFLVLCIYYFIPYFWFIEIKPYFCELCGLSPIYVAAHEPGCNKCSILLKVCVQKAVWFNFRWRQCFATFYPSVMCRKGLWSSAFWDKGFGLVHSGICDCKNGFDLFWQSVNYRQQSKLGFVQTKWTHHTWSLARSRVEFIDHGGNVALLKTWTLEGINMFQFMAKVEHFHLVYFFHLLWA